MCLITRHCQYLGQCIVDVKVTGKRYLGQTLQGIGCGLIEVLSSHFSRNTEKTNLIHDSRCSQMETQKELHDRTLKPCRYYNMLGTTYVPNTLNITILQFFTCFSIGTIFYMHPLSHIIWVCLYRMGQQSLYIPCFNKRKVIRKIISLSSSPSPMSRDGKNQTMSHIRTRHLEHFEYSLNFNYHVAPSVK